jgi:cobalt/nickel transport system permease protein
LLLTGISDLRTRGRDLPSGSGGLRDPTHPVPFDLANDSYRMDSQEVAVHVPDGFIDAPVSVAAGVVAAAAIGVALRGSRRELGDERVAPLAGLVSAFVFAVQLVNFPVAAGTSGHLLGGALAAVLVGPWTGVLCVSVVLLVQLFFADGGLTAYGVNVTCMAVTTALVGWLVFRLLVRLLPKVPGSVVPASFGAALVSVPAAALVFTGIYALGGTTDVPLGSFAAAMIGVHVLIGIGEAVITALVVSSVLAVRPDLVHGARDLVAARRARAVALEVAR